MKLWSLAGAMLSLAGGIFALRPADEQIVILSGDTRGYLSPCGCSSPMMGGIRRRASAIRSMTVPGRTTILDNGGMVEGVGRQDEMKAETIAQAMDSLNATAVNLGPVDTRLGAGNVMQLARLSGNRIISQSIADGQDLGVGDTVGSGPFLVGGVSDAPQALSAPLGKQGVALEKAVQSLVDTAEAVGKVPILMLQGGHQSAVRLAETFTKLALIQYSADGNPTDRPEYVGSTLLATTGEHGKYIVKLVFRKGRFAEYEPVILSPDFKDDPEVSALYSTYLRHVRDEKLLDKLPRTDSTRYASSWACSSCHASAMRVWKSSGHRHAFETLEREGHGADPDCVSCHVLGLQSPRGFVSKAKTPQFAGVACESCHGSAAAHVADPKANRMRTIDKKSCVGCHNLQNSPNFDFAPYWRKIRHR